MLHTNTISPTLKLDTRALASQITLTVELSGLKRWQFFMSVGMILIRLGCWLGGLKVRAE